jgi:hypothetical protein
VFAFYSTAAGHVPISTRKSITKSINSEFSASDKNKMVTSARIEMTISKLEINFQLLGLWFGSHVELICLEKKLA